MSWARALEFARTLAPSSLMSLVKRERCVSRVRVSDSAIALAPPSPISLDVRSR